MYKQVMPLCICEDMSQYLTMLVNIRTSGNIIISGIPQSIAEVNEDLINHGENPVFAVYRPVPTDTIEAAVEPTDYALELLGIPKDRPDAIVALDLPGDNGIEVSGILPLFEPEEGESFKDSVIATFQDLCYIMVSEFEKQFGAGYFENHDIINWLFAIPCGQLRNSDRRTQSCKCLS